jgi:hypothetical protein
MPVVYPSRYVLAANAAAGEREATARPNPRPQKHVPANRPASADYGTGDCGTGDADWRRVRLAVLLARPLCSEPRCGKLATEVARIRSVRDHPSLRLETMNLRGFCKWHFRPVVFDQG